MNKSKTLLTLILSTITLVSCNISKSVNSYEPSTIQAKTNVFKKSQLKKTELKRWSLLDIEKDTIPGMSVDRAYKELLNNKKARKIIVGIIDTGVDINHEALKNVIWKNPKEIANNRIDDDKNGYIDDIHGWNFLGPIEKENAEFERILTNKNLVDTTTYLKAKALNDMIKNQALEKKLIVEQLLTETIKAHEVLTNYFGKTNYSFKETNAIKSKDSTLSKSQKIFQKATLNSMTLIEYQNHLTNNVNELNKVIQEENLKTNYRSILGDNPNDILNTNYGDNNVIGPNSYKNNHIHGTHVAGIVAQIGNKTSKKNGLDNFIEILTIRALPDGDEHDKDIALGIRYAVNNGAKIINLSFGKSLSLRKEWVYEAIQYAEQKDVLNVS